jgi:hypothetical protein
VKFKPNPNAARELARSAEMGRYLENVAEDMADEVDRRAPNWIKRAGAEFVGSSSQTTDGQEGRVVVRSSFWHLPEFGSRNNAPRPYLRPGVQAILSRVGGRWKPQ